ncbi:acetyl-CoA hydrolase/transferase C-terminal domain-containing protein [Haloplanus salinarum]|jgi:succinyl-CoA:acetate CoA-transferase|uniref:acetyl-CoA hydrolase/transferase C-terminal domain-containing protein n=1 Tax=Haloplanus salinarum TaxID=1912324 RepID=UPI00214CE642|nr:acetyl-CoA hydrolase/transferase C-terminal domain-containing protein [Haloplanus salinarum]
MTPGSVTDRFVGDLPVTDAEGAAALVADDATVLTSGFGSVGYPKAVPLAMAEADRDRSLTVVSGGTVGDEIDTDLLETGAIDRRFPYQGTRAARDAVNEGSVAYGDRHVGGVADEVSFGLLADADVAVVEAVAVGEDWLVPSTSVGQTPAFVEAAPRLIVEVNRAQPLELARFHDVYRPSAPPDRDPIPLSAPDGRIGDPFVPFDPERLVAVVETDRPDSPYEFRDPTDDDLAIARHLADFLADEVTRNPVLAESVNLQFGVGSLGNALMGELSGLDVGDRTLGYFGEVIQDGLLDLADRGRLAYASATSLALSRDGQRRLFDDLDRYATEFVLRPTDVSNSPALVDRFGVVAVNSALEVDVYGHANSTHVDGSRVINGVGGSGDFTRNALVSVLALPSTASDGAVSRVVPMVPHVDHTEHDVDVIVTEHGVADLRGLSPRERAAAVVERCADPSVRPALEAYLDRADEGGGHEPHDLDTAFDWR